MFDAEMFKGKYCVTNKIFIDRSIKFYKYLWIIVGMFKEVVMFMKVPFGNYFESIFNVNTIEEEFAITTMMNYVGNDLMGRTSQCMNRHGIPFLKPKFNCSVELSAGNIDFGNHFFCHISFPHNDRTHGSP